MQIVKRRWVLKLEPTCARTPSHSRYTPRVSSVRRLPPGLFQFKFIWDGEWGISMDHQSIVDGDNVNNKLVVPDADLGPAAAAARHRIRTGGDLTDDERARICEMLLQMDANPYSTSAPANLNPL